MYRTILVPLDGSEVAASVLDKVVALARGYQARVLLLTVGQPVRLEQDEARKVQLTLTFQAEAYLKRLHAYLASQGLEVSTTVRIGEPACEILDMAERHQVDLIVINSHGGGGAASPFLGSVAEKIVAAAAIPVFVLHTALRPTKETS